MRIAVIAHRPNETKLLTAQALLAAGLPHPATEYVSRASTAISIEPSPRAQAPLRELGRGRRPLRHEVNGAVGFTRDYRRLGDPFALTAESLHGLLLDEARPHRSVTTS
jgi:hypothetical protein